MKIGMISPNIESEKAIANYSLNLVNNIKKTGIYIDLLDYPSGSFLSVFKVLKKVKPYDAIHIQHEYNLFGWYSLPFYVLYSLLGIFYKKKIVTTMHTILSEKEPLRGNFLKLFLRKRILYPTQNWLIGKVSDKVIVHADFFKTILVEEYKLSGKKIFVLPQGIIENKNLISKEKARKELGLSGKVYLIIGSFVPDHGSDIILKEANKIGKTILVVVNPNAVNDRNKKRISDWLSYNRKIVEQNKSEEYVRFDIKNIPNNLWWKYISAADIVLLPYRGGIGSGVVTDALSAGKPIVASNINFFVEMQKHFKFLRIAKEEKDYPSEIEKAMAPKNYSQMQSECKRYISEFGLSPLAKKYKLLYSSL